MRGGRISVPSRAGLKMGDVKARRGPPRQGPGFQRPLTPEAGNSQNVRDLGEVHDKAAPHIPFMSSEESEQPCRRTSHCRKCPLSQSTTAASRAPTRVDELVLFRADRHCGDPDLHRAAIPARSSSSSSCASDGENWPITRDNGRCEEPRTMQAGQVSCCAARSHVLAFLSLAAFDHLAVVCEWPPMVRHADALLFVCLLMLTLGNAIRMTDRQRVVSHLPICQSAFERSLPRLSAWPPIVGDMQDWDSLIRLCRRD